MYAGDAPRELATVWVAMAALITGVVSYEWGNDDTFRSQTTPKSDYSHILLVPDPELPAPSDGTVIELKAYSTAGGVSVRLVLLRPDVDGAYDTEKFYIIGAVSGMLGTPVDSGPWSETFSARPLTVTKGARVAFAIYTENPMPFEPKQICDTGKMHLIHTFNDDSVNMNTGDRLLFNRNTEERCLKFSYVLSISTTELYTTSTVGLPRVEGTESAPAGDTGLGYGDSGRRQGSDQDQDYQDPCRLASSNCDQMTGNNNGDSDLFRYIIFGPLVVLWIIVSILCTLKIKRRCCAKNGPVVTPVGQAAPGNHRLVPGVSEAQNVDNRRPRFARITLSRAPPQMLMMAQPKPLPQMTPGAALPPYPGLASTGTQPTGPNSFLPSYPPPAYSLSKDTKYNSMETDPGGHEYEFDPGPNAIYSSVQYVDTPLQVGHDDIPEIAMETCNLDAPADGNREQQPLSTWTSSYGMAVSCPYPDPPPPYQQAPDSGHI